MGKIITKIFIIRENGTGTNIKKFELPADDPEGFYGIVELKLRAGTVNGVQIPRQSLHIETIGREEWEKLVGPID